MWAFDGDGGDYRHGPDVKNIDHVIHSLCVNNYFARNGHLLNNNTKPIISTHVPCPPHKPTSIYKTVECTKPSYHLCCCFQTLNFHKTILTVLNC